MTKKKIILSLVIISLLISLSTITMFIKNIRTESYTIGKTITDLNHTESFNIKYDYNSISVNVNVNNSNNNEILNVKIYDPKEILLDEIEVNGNDSINYINNFDGIKGNYKIVFNQDNGVANYNFKIDIYGQN